MQPEISLNRSVFSLELQNKTPPRIQSAVSSEVTPPKGAASFLDRSSCVYGQIKACFSCLGLLSCVFFCAVWFCLLSQVIGWEDYYSRDIYHVEGFPLQRPD